MNAGKVFRPHYTREVLKRRNKLCILHLCLRKARSGKSSDYRDVIVFKKELYTMMQRTANENAAGLRRICKRSDQPKIQRLENKD